MVQHQEYSINSIFVNIINIISSTFSGSAEHILFGDLSALHDFSSLLSTPDIVFQQSVLACRIDITHEMKSITSRHQLIRSSNNVQHA